MRYVGQIFEVPVDVTGLPLAADIMPEILERLHRQHEKEYTYRHETGVGEIINATVTCIGRLPPIHAATIEDMRGLRGRACSASGRCSSASSTTTARLRSMTGRA